MCVAFIRTRVFHCFSSVGQGEDGKPLYTQFDESGFPTHDAAGEAITKSKSKVRHEKCQEKRYMVYAKENRCR